MSHATNLSKKDKNSLLLVSLSDLYCVFMVPLWEFPPTYSWLVLEATAVLAANLVKSGHPQMGFEETDANTMWMQGKATYWSIWSANGLTLI